MCTSVMLLYAFQVMCGYVYEWIGLLSGAFIAGTALGGLAGAAVPDGKRWLVTADAAVGAAAIVFAIVIRLCSGMSPAAAMWLVPCLGAAAGFVTGFEFPVAAKVLEEAGMDASGAGGRLEAADHMGACLGAVFAGVVMGPAVGIFGGLLLVACVKAISLAELVRMGRNATGPKGGSSSVASV